MNAAELLGWSYAASRHSPLAWLHFHLRLRRRLLRQVEWDRLARVAEREARERRERMRGLG